jgi:hypothetical protein
MADKKIASGANALFIFRGFYQNSLQATVERSPFPKSLIIPRSGTAAPIGTPTMQNQKIKRGR